MDKKDYIDTQTKIITMSQIVSELPLQKFISAIDQADTLGPLIDPTLWIQGQNQMKKVKKLAQALFEFQLVSKEIIDKSFMR